MKIIIALLEFLFGPTKKSVVAVVPEVIPPPPHLAPLPVPPPKFLWDTAQNIRHSIRVIGDEEGMSWREKDLMCDIARCESGFNVKAVLVNTPKSIDRGLFQINGYYHPEATAEKAFDPEWNTRWAAAAIKAGKATAYWSASKKNWNKDGRYNGLPGV